MRIATYNVNGVNGRLPRLLEWLEETKPDVACLQEIKTGEGVPTVLSGDFNVVPTNADIYNWWPWQHDAVLQPQTREAWQHFLAQGWTDVTRARRPHERIYTFWVNADDREHRGREKPSDHAPVWIELAWQEAS